MYYKSYIQQILIMQILYGEAHQKQIYYKLKDSKREHAE